MLDVSRYKSFSVSRVSALEEVPMLLKANRRSLFAAAKTANKHVAHNGVPQKKALIGLRPVFSGHTDRPQ